MKTSFANLVEQIRSRPQEEKEELRFLLEKALIQERRRQMLENYRQSREELKSRRLTFSGKIGQLKSELASH
ncbi:MAG: hypothetical protein HY735_18825 [Verrucomicrobia bacterium]|nr:hypothetical protein [Verrucomicrobiota bacterium]